MQKHIDHTYFTLKLCLFLNFCRYGQPLHQQSLENFYIVTVNSHFLWLCGELLSQSFKNVLKKQLLCHRQTSQSQTLIMVNEKNMYKLYINTNYTLYVC